MRNKLPFELIERKELIRTKAETDSEKGCKPLKRNVEIHIKFGFVNLDKPSGPTSQRTVECLKDILKIKKAGHSGTLDPKVTGMLPIGINNSTKVLQTLLLAGKEYVALMKLHKKVSEKKILETFEKFKGEIEQMPPVKSRVKRQWRKRNIYYIDVLEIKGQNVLFKVGCQAGTYIRKLIHDFGQKIGTGANMIELRRTKAGPFNEETNLVTLQDLKDALYYYKQEKNEKCLRHCILPIEFAISHLPKIWIMDSAVNPVCHGAQLAVPGISKLHSNIDKDNTVAIMTLKNELVAIVKAKMTSEQMLKSKKGFACKTLRVIMPIDVY